MVTENWNFIFRFGNLRIVDHIQRKCCQTVASQGTSPCVREGKLRRWLPQQDDCSYSHDPFYIVSTLSAAFLRSIINVPPEDTRTARIYKRVYSSIDSPLEFF